MNEDRKFIRAAIRIALDSIRKGGGPFGAVIVREGRIISRSGNNVVLKRDPTAHAEILAIRKAAKLLENHDLSGCVLYTSCEPCPMCLGAIYWSHISRVVYSASRHDAAKAGFDDKLIYRELALDPAERKITFSRISDPSAKEVFGEWEKYSDRIAY